MSPSNWLSGLLDAVTPGSASAPQPTIARTHLAQPDGGGGGSSRFQSHEYASPTYLSYREFPEYHEIGRGGGAAGGTAAQDHGGRGKRGGEAGGAAEHEDEMGEGRAPYLNVCRVFFPFILHSV